ncbi:hypothetical protein ABZT06_08440 [Streptomyces sp. NPDC005483]|uniref:hypothetical protein n=1 Tax=Streptomyces sp. NPDC005483 TaxID=3154882 RepID=UPI00339ED5B4
MPKTSRIERQITNLIRSAVDARYVDRSGEGLPGTPDLASRYCKIAVFVDGCHWHGCPEHTSGALATARQERDAAINSHLATIGWAVFRVREHDEHLAAFIVEVASAFDERAQARRAEILAHLEAHVDGGWCGECELWPHISNAGPTEWCSRCDVHTKGHEWEPEDWQMFAA